MSIVGDVTNIADRNVSLLHDAIRRFNMKKIALYRWLLFYLRRGGTVEDSVFLARLMGLPTFRDRMRAIVEQAHRNILAHSPKVRGYLRDLVVEEQVADTLTRLIGEVERVVSVLTPDNAEEVLERLYRVKLREAHLVHFTRRTIIVEVPERMGRWIPVLTDVLDRINEELEEVERLRERLRLKMYRIQVLYEFKKTVEGKKKYKGDTFAEVRIWVYTRRGERYAPSDFHVVFDHLIRYLFPSLQAALDVGSAIYETEWELEEIDVDEAEREALATGFGFEEDRFYRDVIFWRNYQVYREYNERDCVRISRARGIVPVEWRR